MTHSHPLPDNENLCPYCSTDPGVCCRVLAQVRAARRAREQRAYAKNPDRFRAKARRSYANRPTKPTPPAPRADTV